MFIFYYQGSSKQCYYQTKQLFFLSQDILNTRLLHNKTQQHVKERSYHNTLNYLLHTKLTKLMNMLKKILKLLDFVVFDTILHHIINKCYKWCYIKIVFTKQPYF